MGIEEATRQADWITPPKRDAPWVIASSASNTTSNITVLAATNTYFAVQADGAAIYVAFGDSGVQVDETVTGTPAVKGCAKIPDGGVLNVKLAAGLHNFVAHKTASGSAKLRIWQSGPSRPT